jgi:hypothetical protein
MTVVHEGTGAPEAPAQDIPAVDTQATDSAPEENAGEQASPPRERSEVPKSVISRIGHLTRKNEAAIREAAQWRERAEALERQYAGQQGQQQPQQPQSREPQVDPQQIFAKAREAAAFDLRCNAVAEKGKAIPGFDTALTNLGMIGLDNESLAVIVDADDAPKLIAHLGQNLDEAAEIFALSPAAMARRLAKLETTLNAPPAVSTAPNPLNPVRSKSSSSDPKPGEPGWAKWRNKQLAER